MPPFNSQPHTHSHASCGICLSPFQPSVTPNETPTPKGWCASCVNFELTEPFLKQQSVGYTCQEARTSINRILAQALDPARASLQAYLRRTSAFTLDSFYSDSSDEYEGEDREDAWGYISVKGVGGGGGEPQWGTFDRRALPRPREASIASLSVQLHSLEMLSQKRLMRKLGRTVETLRRRNVRMTGELEQIRSAHAERRQRVLELNTSLTQTRASLVQPLMAGVSEAHIRALEARQRLSLLQRDKCGAINAIFFPRLGQRVAEIQFTRIVGFQDFKFTRLEELNLFLEKLVRWQVMLAKVMDFDLPFWEVVSFIPSRDFYNAVGGRVVTVPEPLVEGSGILPVPSMRDPSAANPLGLSLLVNSSPTIRLTNVISNTTRLVSFAGVEFSKSQSLPEETLAAGKTTIPLSSTTLNSRRRNSVPHRQLPVDPNSQPKARVLKEEASVHRILPVALVKMDPSALEVSCLKLAMVVINLKAILGTVAGDFAHEVTVEDIVLRVDEVILDAATFSQTPCPLSATTLQTLMALGGELPEVLFAPFSAPEMVTLSSVAKYIITYLDAQ